VSPRAKLLRWSGRPPAVRSRQPTVCARRFPDGPPDVRLLRGPVPKRTMAPCVVISVVLQPTGRHSGVVPGPGGTARLSCPPAPDAPAFGQSPLALPPAIGQIATLFKLSSGGALAHRLLHGRRAESRGKNCESFDHDNC
jgi:hypothetical protein